MPIFISRCLCFNRFRISNGSMLVVPCRTRSTKGVLTVDNEYEYIQKSTLPTMHFQPSLPRLPVPKLEKTCERYLRAQKPLLIDEQLRHTESCVKRFLSEEGPILQRELEQWNSKNRHTSYITEYWFDMYLRDRKPLPINYNPTLVFVPEENTMYNQQLVKTTNLIVSSLRFMKSLRTGILEPEVYHLNPIKSDTKLFRTICGALPPFLSWYGAYLMKAFPLDMSQFPNLFNTTRIPELEKDMIYQDQSARHIVVMRKGHFYTFDVLDHNGCIHTPLDIASNLKFILEDTRPENQCPLGTLTTSERDQWAMNRYHLTEIGNQDILRKIDSAVFLLCLDDEVIGKDYNKMFRLFLHGNGINRWFDKSFSLIVTKDGVAGVNFEHSWGDGVAILRYFQDVKADIAKKPQFHPEDLSRISSNSIVEKIDFISDARTKDTVDRELRKYRDWTEKLDVNYLLHEGFGKKEFKKFKVSPDAMMQLAFQLAYYKQEGCTVSTYESCSTSAFKHGRTEAIRPCTSQTKAVCEMMTQKLSKTSVSQLRKMVLECSNVHNNLTKEAAMGQGFDRHLFALKKIWEKSETRKPAIYEDPAYDALNYNILSTSTLSSPAVLAGGFGPVVWDGYGIGYMIQDQKLGAMVTSYKGQRNGSDYISCLHSAFNDIHRVLASGQS
ncbi:carnitine O-palmitoyltransferase 2, mitochondrial [Orussus abietinus]|uniref:carnitine O-palmitoyltransferase 2, mitochondrial n=1 Tax=Orussus abietinus TaxID=222816 RepID=UPI0006269266|nr:carnitine O-palmitoyltransferase 2, mitochondrial [Orussus abietinus]XP_012277608.1 carnitine O-palmitoyltransferase 2, mitochondrial [Orussus abietinus]